jgi:hypothetical protein
MASVVGKTVRGVGKLVKLTFGLIGLIILIVVIVAIVGIGKKANQDKKQSANVAAHYSQIRMGMSKERVEAILGTPEDPQHFESAFGGTTTTEDCIYYGSLAATSYQFCFTNDRLDAKNTY